MTMNYSKDGLRVCHHEKKYFCSLCNFRIHKKYNLEVHKKNKHGTSQTGSGALLSDNQCSYSSSRKYDLKSPEKLKHYQKKNQVPLVFLLII